MLACIWLASVVCCHMMSLRFATKLWVQFLFNTAYYRRPYLSFVDVEWGGNRMYWTMQEWLSLSVSPHIPWGQKFYSGKQIWYTHKCKATLQCWVWDQPNGANVSSLCFKWFGVLVSFTFIGSSITMLTMPSPLAAKWKPSDTRILRRNQQTIPHQTKPAAMPSSILEANAIKTAESFHANPDHVVNF